MSTKDQKTVLSLHHERKDVDSEEDRVVDVFDCNGIEVVPVQSICLYSTIPRFVLPQSAASSLLSELN